MSGPKKDLRERLQWPYVSGERLPPDWNDPEMRPEVADRLYLDIMIRRADMQISQIDALDAKVAAMFAAASTILPVTLGIYSVTADEIAKTPFWSVFFILLSVTAYLGSASVFVIGYWPKPWDSRPKLRQWGQVFSAEAVQSLETIHAWLGNSLWDSIKDNSRQIDRKIKLAKWAVILLLAEVVFLTAVIALPLL